MTSPTRRMANDLAGLEVGVRNQPLLELLGCGDDHCGLLLVDDVDAVLALA